MYRAVIGKQWMVNRNECGRKWPFPITFEHLSLGTKETLRPLFRRTGVRARLEAGNTDFRGTIIMLHPLVVVIETLTARLCVCVCVCV